MVLHPPHRDAVLVARCTCGAEAWAWPGHPAVFSHVSGCPHDPRAEAARTLDEKVPGWDYDDPSRPHERFALVHGADSYRQVEAFLPSNYRIILSIPQGDKPPIYKIGGHDYAGWTMEDYIVPRIASSGHMRATPIGDTQHHA